MLDAERRAREIAENAQAEAEAAREEAVRAREEAERAHRLETQARERLQVLVEAGVAMAASLEVRSVLSAATAAAARRVCDYSVAFAVDREGRVQAAVGAHRDPARFGMVERMANAHLPDPDDPDSIVANVLKTGEAALIAERPPRADGADDGARRAARARSLPRPRVGDRGPARGARADARRPRTRARRSVEAVRRGGPVARGDARGPRRSRGRQRAPVRRTRVRRRDAAP